MFDTTHTHLQTHAGPNTSEAGQDALCLHNSLGAPSPTLSVSGLILFNLMLLIHLSYIALDSHLAVAWNWEEQEGEEEKEGEICTTGEEEGEEKRET